MRACPRLPLLALALTVPCVGGCVGDSVNEGPSLSVWLPRWTGNTGTVLAVLTAVLGLLVLAVRYIRAKPPTVVRLPWLVSSDGPAGSAEDGVWHSVYGVSLALDASLRAGLQASLASADGPRNARARVALLGAALGHARLAAVVGKSLAPRMARRTFTALTADLRARDAPALASATATAAFRTSAAEPVALCVVSVFAVTATLFRPLSGLPDRAAVEEALDRLVPADPEALVDFEVVWSPATEGATFALDAVAVAHPELYTLVGRPT